MTEKEISEEASTRIFWVIQTVFSFVLAKSIFDFKDALLDPLNNQIAFLGVIVAYGTALWSWIDYSYTSIVSPYDLKSSALEWLRFIVDLFIVFMYAALIFTVGALLKSTVTDISPTLTAYYVIFIGYFASGLLRIIQFGRRRSSIWLILCFLIVFIALRLSYRYLLWYGRIETEVLNVAALVTAGLAMISYRLIRKRLRRRTMWIAVDVDGVLANQIDTLLPVLESEHGVSLQYKDITEWDLPIANKGLASIIKEAQKSKHFISKMSPIPGAQKALTSLSSKYKIAIITARDPGSDKWTQEWLRKHGMPFDVYENLKEGSKQDAQQDVSVLIDDYIGNVDAFLGKGDGKAILFSQPWNTDRSALERYVVAERLAFANNWPDVISILEKWGVAARPGTLGSLIVKKK